MIPSRIKANEENMKKLLVVEDNQGFREILTALLNVHLANLDILSAENGMKAVKIMETNRVDVIVTDLQMPLMDGYALAQYRNQAYPRIPIIGMTADLNPMVETKLASLGVRRYLAKPFDVRLMVHAISSELGDEVQQFVTV